MSINIKKPADRNLPGAARFVNPCGDELGGVLKNFPDSGLEHRNAFLLRQIVYNKNNQESRGEHEIHRTKNPSSINVCNAI